MQSKLTLTIEKEIIDQAKEFSRQHHKSLSMVVEGYLRQITHPAPPGGEITPLVAELTGLVSPKRAGRCKDEYADYLAEKYK